MGQNTSIEWSQSTWTPIRARVKQDAATIAAEKGYTSLVQIAERMAGHIGPHCEHVSDGCTNCYSDTNNSRCLPSNGTGLPFDRRSRDLVDIFLDEKLLMQPLHWKKPRNVFACSQTDLFADFVPDEMIDSVFAVSALCFRHTLQVLTKRAERMREYWSNHERAAYIRDVLNNWADIGRITQQQCIQACAAISSGPLPNVHLGVSVEDQQRADERIPHLLRTPAAVRWVSYEPALGPVDFDAVPITLAPGFFGSSLKWHHRGYCHKMEGIPYPTLDWIVVGGESGAGARPFDIQWARDVIAQCKAAGVRCFVKQLGAAPYREGAHRQNDPGEVPGTHREHDQMKLRDRKGGDPSEWPSDLRVREMPR